MLRIYCWICLRYLSMCLPPAPCKDQLPLKESASQSELSGKVDNFIIHSQCFSCSFMQVSFLLLEEHSNTGQLRTFSLLSQKLLNTLPLPAGSMSIFSAWDHLPFERCTRDVQERGQGSPVLPTAARFPFYFLWIPLFLFLGTD